MNVPFLLPRSRRMIPFRVSRSSQCRRETRASGTTRSHSGLVPTIRGIIPSGASIVSPCGRVTVTRTEGRRTELSPKSDRVHSVSFSAAINHTILDAMNAGEVVGDRFEIIRLAGSGGMGEVFQAHDRVKGELVAVKVLLDGRSSDRVRFEREAEALSELRHPGIVQYVAHG